MEIIRLKSVTKRFGDFTAVKDISLSLESGTINGFLGPNGAGKTTTIKMICGLLRPDCGEIYVNNIDVIKYPEKARRYTGYMSQNFTLYEDLTARENILFFADLLGVDRKEIPQRLKDLCLKLDLTEYLDILTGELPLGIKQRVALATATIHRPSILFLDEPTSGVDPLSREEFFKFISEYIRSYQATAIVSTHYLKEALYCNSIYLFNKGEIILKGDPIEILKGFEYNVFEVRISRDTDQTLLRENMPPEIVESYVFGKKMRFIVDKRFNVERFSSIIGIEKDLIKISKPTFEDIFIVHTND